MRDRTRLVTGLVGAITIAGALWCSPSWAEKPAQKPPPAPAPDQQPAKDKSAGSCTQVNASVISEAYGYKHVVSLRNGCDKPVECQVWTDVDPTPRHVLRAGKGETVEVITRIGSPAREFKALKECRYL
jgi:hypothetical protein